MKGRGCKTVSTADAAIDHVSNPINLWSEPFWAANGDPVWFSKHICIAFAVYSGSTSGWKGFLLYF